MQVKSKYKSGYQRKKNGKKYLLIMLSIVLFAGVVGTGAYLFYYISQKDTTTQETKSSITMYQAAQTINRGELITASVLVETKANPACEELHYSSLDCIGQVAIVDIPQGMTLMNNMYRMPDVQPGDREVECEIIALSDNLNENDYVDVRLMMPNGEDYILLAKKAVHDLYTSEDGQDQVCYLWLSEEEILYYSAAVVDAYLYQGASLYTTKYIEPTIQEASYVTYVPSLGTITMMKENPNLFELALSKLRMEDRKLLENRLTDYLNLDIRERNWTISGKDQEPEEIQQSRDESQEEVQTNQEDSSDKLGTDQEDLKKEVKIDTGLSSEEDKVEASAFVEDE